MDPFKGLADSQRRNILELLIREPLNVNGIAEYFPEMSRPAVSQHLAMLEDSGLVKLYKAGRERYACLNAKGFQEVQEWVGEFLRLRESDKDYGVLINPDNLKSRSELTRPVMLQAMLTRDRRFEGKFYIAVKTTGIFCNMTCSAKPKPENVLFYFTREEATKNGFRACKRCKP